MKIQELLDTRPHGRGAMGSVAFHPDYDRAFQSDKTEWLKGLSVWERFLYALGLKHYQG